MQLMRRFGAGVLWNSVGTVALQGGTFLTNLIVANLLGPETFGRYGIVIATAQMLGGVLQFSTGMAATRFLGELREKDPERASLVLGVCSRISFWLGLLGSFVLLAAAGAISGQLLRADGLTGMLMLSAPIVLFSVLMGFQVGALLGLEGYRRASTTLVGLMLVQVASVGAAAYLFGLPGAVAGTVANLALRTLVCHRLLQSEASRQGLSSRARWTPFVRDLTFNFLLPGSLTGITALPALWLASVILARHPDGFRQLAFFNVALALRAALLIFPWILNTVGLSLLKAHAPGGRNRVLLASFLLTAAAAGGGAALVVLLDRQVLALYGPEYAVADTVLRVMMLSLLAEALAMPLYQALAGAQQMWRTFIFAMLPRDLLMVSLGSWLALQHGAIGLAWGHAAAWSLALLGSLLLFGRLRTSLAGAP